MDVRRLTGVIAAAALLAACAGAYAVDRHHVTRDSVLVVGDSLITQAGIALGRDAPAGAHVWVAGGVGSAPCDWARGFDDPFDHGARNWFNDTFDRYHPAAVVFAFSGNPGLSGPAAGCVDVSRPYTLAAVLTSYREAIAAMASYAARRGAVVYLAAAPARNPAVPASEAPFNGVPALNALYAELAALGGWRFDPTGAQVLSGGSQIRWQLTLPCDASDAGRCVGGQVQIRAGGGDIIHLDDAGAGGARFALGLLARPFAEQGVLVGMPLR